MHSRGCPQQSPNQLLVACLKDPPATGRMVRSSISLGRHSTFAMKGCLYIASHPHISAGGRRRKVETEKGWGDGSQGSHSWVALLVDPTPLASLTQAEAGILENILPCALRAKPESLTRPFIDVLFNFNFIYL